MLGVEHSKHRASSVTRQQSTTERAKPSKEFTRYPLNGFLYEMP